MTNKNTTEITAIDRNTFENVPSCKRNRKGHRLQRYASYVFSHKYLTTILYLIGDCKKRSLGASINYLPSSPCYSLPHLPQKNDQPWMIRVAVWVGGWGLPSMVLLVTPVAKSRPSGIGISCWQHCKKFKAATALRSQREERRWEV